MFSHSDKDKERIVYVVLELLPTQSIFEMNGHVLLMDLLLKV